MVLFLIIKIKQSFSYSLGGLISFLINKNKNEGMIDSLTSVFQINNKNKNLIKDQRNSSIISLFLSLYTRKIESLISFLKNNIKNKNKKIITPNLTLYYPLKSSILSVSIRFMGTILLLLVFFSFSVFILITIFDFNFELLCLVLTLLTYLIILSLFFHTINSIIHFFKS